MFATSLKTKTKHLLQQEVKPNLRYLVQHVLKLIKNASKDSSLFLILS